MSGRFLSMSSKAGMTARSIMIFNHDPIPLPPHRLVFCSIVNQFCVLGAVLAQSGFKEHILEETERKITPGSNPISYPCGADGRRADQGGSISVFQG